MLFNFIGCYQVTLSHKFCEIFHQEPLPTSISLIREARLAILGLEIVLRETGSLQLLSITFFCYSKFKYIIFLEI